jgi:predicted 3-demethylubiquinone-9 3-methyltransferase (glyoxalase superfamily)
VGKITPCLWFDEQAEDAANFYVSVFKDGEILGIERYGEGGPKPAGTALTVTFRVNGQEFVGLNGGPEFTFDEAVSFMIDCADQEEVDYYWEALTEGGEPGPCGWLKDKFGLSWQVIPDALPRLLGDEDRDKAGRVMQAMMQMGKLDVAQLEAAAAGA